ncbi:unnamed protein product [Linum tenue]|uniref:Uncharacterized protein n=1 Tax=Linum tenue TaxID=586396 RepID=A0AAV0NVS9_9ROSI|nr:unnamed protein product [Linum tenue]CAI0462308.1 unnamed protein product [Linum tenue]
MSCLDNVVPLQVFCEWYVGDLEGEVLLLIHDACSLPFFKLMLCILVRTEIMDTSNPAILVNGNLLPMHVRKRVRTVIQVLNSERGSVIGKSTDDQQLVIKGSPPSTPLTNFVEVIGIADSDKSIQAEIWTNFGDNFMHLPSISFANLRMLNTSTCSCEQQNPANGFYEVVQ